MEWTHLHLISDSTAETVCSIARAAMAQLDYNIDLQEHVWSLVRTKGQIDRVLQEIEDKPGIVLYTIVDQDLQERLKKGCIKLNVPCLAVLNRIVVELSSHLNVNITAQPGRQHELDAHYFSRVDAINYTLAHDDGQATRDLEDADIVIVGVSRTSKSPTCVYIAYRGLKAANIPYVSGCPLPNNLFSLQKPLIVGLTISIDRLVQIRKSRLLSICEERDTDYVDPDIVRDEIKEARKLFTYQGWPIIDVTRRSVEETAATIIQFYQERKQKIESFL
jgi:regulator of PEP synthase PpsR (kinase-PPPase family)